MTGAEFEDDELFLKAFGHVPKEEDGKQNRTKEPDGTPQQIQKKLTDSLVSDGSLSAGFAQYMRAELQQDVKPGMPVCFTAELGGHGGISLVQQGSVIRLCAGETGGVYLLWYSASAAPASGVTTSLLLESNGKELLGSRSFCRNAYFMGTCMSLGAHAAVLVPKGEERRIRLVNADSAADIGNASVLVIRLR